MISRQLCNSRQFLKVCSLPLILKISLKLLTARIEIKNSFSVAEAVVEGLAKQFPEIRPSTDEEMILIKREFVNFHMTPTAEQDEVR